MPLLETAEISISGKPDRVIMFIPGLKPNRARSMALAALGEARRKMPKSTGYAANRMQPIWGKDFFGLTWKDSYVFFQDRGIRPFTMNNLAGKVIPMWIDDPTGAEARANPKAEKRRTENGRQQILIFRKAAKPGAVKKVAVRDRNGRLLRWRKVPAAYPGAPGRIARRSYDERRGTNSGKIAQLVPRPHVGVRWRHPGIVNREFMQHGLQQVAQMARLEDLTVYATHRRS